MPIPFFALIWHFIRSVSLLLKDPETRGVVYLVVIVLLAGMTFYHSVEGWGWLDSLYFSVITLTTVGYGDLSPKTDGGKVFTMVYIVVGLGILAGFITLIAQKQSAQARQSREQGVRRIGRRRQRRGANDAPEASDSDNPSESP